MTTDVAQIWRTHFSTDVRPWSFDLSPEMDSGDAVGATTVTLTDLLTGAALPTGLTGTASVAGNIVTQTVNSTLLPGHNYRLTFATNMGGSKVTTANLFLTVPS